MADNDAALRFYGKNGYASLVSCSLIMPCRTSWGRATGFDGMPSGAELRVFQIGPRAGKLICRYEYDEIDPIVYGTAEGVADADSEDIDYRIMSKALHRT